MTDQEIKTLIRWIAEESKEIGRCKAALDLRMEAVRVISSVLEELTANNGDHSP